MGLNSRGLNSGGLRSVSVERKIPSEAFADYYAPGMDNSGGDTVSTWTDQLGYADVTGSGTYRESVQNSNAAIEFNGTDDGFDSTASTSYSQPNTIFLAGKLTGTSDNQTYFDSVDARQQLRWGSSKYEFYAGSLAGVGGSLDSDWHIYTAVFDGGSSYLRVDGSQTGSGNPGSQGIDGIALGYVPGEGQYLEGFIGEIIFCDGALSSSTISDEESRLADFWGVTI